MPPRYSWLPLWYLLLRPRPTTAPLAIWSKLDHAKHVIQTCGISTARIHTLGLLDLLIDKHAKRKSAEITSKFDAAMKKRNSLKSPMYLTLFNLEAQNAAAPKLPRFKSQKPAAGGAPIAKYNQNCDSYKRPLHRATRLQSWVSFLFLTSLAQVQDS